MKKYIIIISSIISIWLTSYLSILPLNWNSQADISNLYSTSITPAWFTFSIWSIIYISWLFLWVYYVIKNIKINNNKILLFVAAQIISALWLLPWHYNYIGISLIIMIVLLLILWYLSINREKNIVFQNISDLFFWWILVASIANIHIFLVYSDLYLWPIILWIISLVIWWIINYIMIRKYKTIIPSIVFLWALIWIISKQTESYILLTSYIIITTLILIILKNRLIKK